MKFGFDIDDTLINLREHAFHLYNKKLGREVGLEVFRALQRVEIHEAFGLTDEQGSHMWSSSLEDIYFTDCPAFEHALETLQQLEADGHEIYFITSRPKQYCERTREWMKEKGFPVKDEQFYCGMQDHEKIETIKSLNLDYYFDDKPAVLLTLEDVETKAIVMNQSYNQDVNLPRLNSWTEFKSLVNI
ncbi:5' nucleotidase, NT5C type [Rummeliibacillus sp. JY-2-4R]